MQRLISALFLLAGVVNLLPLVGVLSADRLAALYGVQIRNPTLLILMRHRAVLFGIIGLLLVTAAFRPGLQPAALLAGLVSMLSFILLAFLVGEYSPVLRRVIVIDAIASIGLVIAAVCLLRRAPM